MCMIYVEDEEQEIPVHYDHLEPVIPSINDQVFVLCGHEKGSTGTLINIDGQEGLVQLGPDSVQMLQLKFLCKYQR